MTIARSWRRASRDCQRAKSQHTKVMRRAAMPPKKPRRRFPAVEPRRNKSPRSSVTARKTSDRAAHTFDGTLKQKFLAAVSRKNSGTASILSCVRLLA